MSAADDKGNALAVVPDEPTILRPGDLGPERDDVRAVRADVCELKIKIDMVLDFLRRDREERIEDRERLNQLERDILERKKQEPRRKAARK